MSVRLSLEEYQRLEQGIRGGAAGAAPESGSITLAEYRRIVSGSPGRHRRLKGEASPGQRILYDFLKQRFHDRVCSEYKFLPDRRYRVDIALPDVRLAIEVDGWQNHGRTLEAFKLDRVRYRQLVKAGWVLLPFTHKEASHPAQCLPDILATLNRLGQP